MRKITRIKRSIRAISPVISVLLMIAIAVIAALVAYAWVMGYLGFQTDKSGDQIEIQSYTVDQNLTLYVQNTGQGLVNLKQDSSVYVNDVLYNILEADDATVTGSALIPISGGQTVKVEVAYYNYQQGDRIKVVTYEGTFMEITGTLPTSTTQSFIITSSAGAHGSISPNGPQTVTAGSSITFTVTASSGYHIDDVYVDGSSVTLDAQNRYTFTDVQANHVIHATFGANGVDPQNRYTITVTQNDNGNINPGTSTYDAGYSPSFTITPSNGYHIASITANGVPVTVTNQAGQTYTFAALSAAGTLTATFEANPVQYQVTVSQTSNGVIAPGTSSYPSGSTPSFTITPNTGYYIVSITANGNPVTVINSAGQTYTFTALSADGTLTAAYAAITVQYTITVSQTSNGVIAPGTGSYDAGSTPSFTITPNTGYHIASITANGASVTVTNSAGQTYTFAPLSAIGSLTATYEANQPTQYTITVTQTANGIIAPGTSTYGAGETPSFTITPNNGYHIASITANGNPVTVANSAGQTYTFTALSADGTLTATYAANTVQYQIVVTQTSNGVIAPETSSYPSGSTPSFTITPNTGYHIATITANGASVMVTNSAGQTYTFAALSADGTLTATYQANVQQYTVTFVMGTGGQSITPSVGDHSYAAGTNVPISATPNSGYTFSSWTFNGNLDIDNPASATTSVVINGAGTITANFIQSSSYKLVFTAGASQTLLTGQPSQVITIQRQESDGDPYRPSTSLTVSLTATSGSFYSDQECTNQITTSRIDSGRSTTSFYYKSTSVGTPTLTASATSIYQPASTTFTITEASAQTPILTSSFDGPTWEEGWSYWGNPPWGVTTSPGTYLSAPRAVYSNSGNQGAFSCDRLVQADNALYITVSFDFKIVNTEENDFQLRYSGTRSNNFGDCVWEIAASNLGDRTIYTNEWNHVTINIFDPDAFTDYFRIQFYSQSLSSDDTIYVDNVQVVMYY